MRDPLCNESHLLETIEFYKEQIYETKEEITELKADIEKGIQRYPRDNQSIIYASFSDLFFYSMNILLSEYSLGNPPDVMIDDYLDAITYLENLGEEEIGYINLLWMIALGILLEVNKEELKRLSGVIEKQKIEDVLIDFFFKSM